MMRIAILGAECTGKSDLAQALSLRLSKPPSRAICIAEVLREWCDREGRTPLPHEQQGVALEQARQVETAPPCDFLIVDSHPLMTAIYSELHFSDLSLYPSALNHLRHYQLTLVMGMDLDWVADGIQRDGPVMRQRVNDRLRQILVNESLPYTAVYGSGPARTDAAMRAIKARANPPHLKPSNPSAPWVWHCGNCSDAQCEKHMFTDRLRIDKT